jgi:hypothetical protein
MRKPPAALRTFLEAYDPAVGRLFFAARAAVLAAAPKADELIYDAYNAVAAAYTFSDRLKEAFCHIAAYGSYVNLGFNRGARLPDPDGILVGSGTSIRHVRIDATEDLQRPAVKAHDPRGRCRGPHTRARGKVECALARTGYVCKKETPDVDCGPRHEDVGSREGERRRRRRKGRLVCKAE